MTAISDVFSRFIAILLFLFSAFLPFNPEGLDLTVNVSNENEQIITVEWQNNTGRAIGIPRYFIEKAEDGEWTNVPFSSDFGFPDIASTYYPSEKGKITIKSESAFGEPLPSGTYRVTVYYDIRDTETTNSGASTEFTI